MKIHFTDFLSRFKLAAAQFQICEPDIITNDRNLGDNFTAAEIYDLIREVSNYSLTFSSLHY